VTATPPFGWGIMFRRLERLFNGGSDGGTICVVQSEFQSD
jgi:hypothetical protein